MEQGRGSSAKQRALAAAVRAPLAAAAAAQQKNENSGVVTFELKQNWCISTYVPFVHPRGTVSSHRASCKNSKTHHPIISAQVPL